MKIALAQINPIVGDLDYNTKKICSYIEKAKHEKAELVLFSEMCLLGYPPEDLLLLPSFIKAIRGKLDIIVQACHEITAIIGVVRENTGSGEKKLYNSAAIIQNKKLLGFQDKTLLPDYDVFSERRYFEPSSELNIWEINGKKTAITICEDLWEHAGEVGYSFYLRDPVLELKNKEIDLVLNLSASPYYMKRHETRLRVCSKAAQTLKCPVLLCNQVGGNDSLIFDGYSMFVNKKGELIAHAKAFEEDLLFVNLDEKKAPSVIPSEYVEDLYHALVLGVRDYFKKQGFDKAILGLSGGIDSALVACIAKEALGSDEVRTLFLPSRYSSPESREDAFELSKTLDLNITEISIEKPFQSFLELLTPHFEGKKADVTEENLQARIRGMILMAFCNKFSCLLLGTGNKSEMAMGYSTLYGDMCGGLAVLSDVSKAQVYALARWINRKKEIIPQRILTKPPSAELRPNQKDTDSLPEYSIVDTILTSYVEEHLSPEEIAKKSNISLPLVKELVKKIHLSEYKRRQSPPGLRVTKKSFSIGRRFPIVQHWNL